MWTSRTTDFDKRMQVSGVIFETNAKVQSMNFCAKFHVYQAIFGDFWLQNTKIPKFCTLIRPMPDSIFMKFTGFMRI